MLSVICKLFTNLFYWLSCFLLGKEWKLQTILNMAEMLGREITFGAKGKSRSTTVERFVAQSLFFKWVPTPSHDQF